MPSPLRPLLLGALVAASLVLAVKDVVADVIHLKNGDKVEGKILSRGSSGVKIRTRFGTVTIQKSRIDRIEEKATPIEVYEERLRSLSKEDAEGRYQLAMYCKGERLSKQYRALLQQVLRLEPQHAGANQEVGNVRYDGRWFSKEALAEYQEKEREKKEALGLVHHDGKWMTEEEAMRARGNVLVDGTWMPKEEAERLRAARDFEQVFGTPLTISNSTHFSVRNTRTQDSNEYLLDSCEEVLAHFVELSQPDEVERPFFEKYDFFVYILDRADHTRKFIESGYIDRYKPPKDTAGRYVEQTNFSYYFPIPLIVLTEGRHLRGGDDREVSLRGMTLIHLGHVLTRRLKRGGRPPSWAEAGLAHYLEGRFNDERTVSVVEYPFYEPYVDKWIEDWETFEKWRWNLGSAEVRAGLPSLRELNATPIEELRIDALAKCWSLVSFLLEKRRAQFFDFIRRVDVRFQGEKTPASVAFEEAFPISPEALEAEWETWLR